MNSHEWCTTYALARVLCLFFLLLLVSYRTLAPEAGLKSERGHRPHTGAVSEAEVPHFAVLPLWSNVRHRYERLWTAAGWDPLQGATLEPCGRCCAQQRDRCAEPQ